MGNVTSKNTVSDFLPVEMEYGNSVFSTVLYAKWKNTKINIIDTPGSIDFIGGAISALNISDVGVMLLSAQHGIEVGTELLDRYAANLGKPLLFAINQLDHENITFDRIVEQLKAKYGGKTLILQFPVNPGNAFNSFIDILQMKKYEWTADGKSTAKEIPEEFKSQVEDYRNSLIEAAAESDEKLMDTFFENGTLSDEDILLGLKKGISNRDIMPIFCLSASKNIGTIQLLDFIDNVIPSASETSFKTTDGKELNYNINQKTSLFVFKTAVEPHLGEINYFRVISGKVVEGQDLVNTYNGTKERLSQLFVVTGKKREKISELIAGDIGATVKLKNTKTSHFLNDKDFEIKFKDIDYPQPKYSIAVKAQNESQEEKLGEILTRMHDEDPTLIIEYSKELKQRIIHGQGEYHLNTMKWRLQHNENIEIDFITPKIPYRETITRKALADYRHKKQSGGAGQFGEVHMIIEPYEDGMPDTTLYKFDEKEIKVSIRNKEVVELDWGGKLVFHNCIVGGVIDNRFMPAILKGLMDKMEEGPLTGSYARDIRVCVYDGKMHSVDSNEISFMLAGRNAFNQAFKKAGPKILEPIYDLVVFVPEEKMGDVMSDLQTRRAIIMGMDAEGGFQKIKAKIPLKEIQRYSTALGSLTAGRATFTKSFSSYERVPNEIQEELLKAYEEEQED